MRAQPPWFSPLASCSIAGGIERKLQVEVLAICDRGCRWQEGAMVAASVSIHAREPAGRLMMPSPCPATASEGKTLK